MSGEHTEYVTQLITSKVRKAKSNELPPQPVEQNPYQDEYLPTQQNLPNFVFGRNPTPPLPTPEVVQIEHHASLFDTSKPFPYNDNRRLHVWPSNSQRESELNVPKRGKMYASLAENIYSHLKEHTMCENYNDQEIIDVGLQIADAADLLRILGKSTDKIVLAGEKAHESAILLNDVLRIQNRASELFKESLSLLRSMKFDQ
ncbi:hypothetical protein Fmac_012262 [Flemingia macrophylla]|uniref:Uncharacterized protein n=1 Tax=Flemingia macrophylla TaxID=520843 RepID=A0ABD1MQ68_9FABA